VWYRPVAGRATLARNGSRRVWGAAWFGVARDDGTRPHRSGWARCQPTAAGAGFGAAHSEKGDKTMAQGTVKSFNDEQGFGFIADDAGGEDVFVHYTEIQTLGVRSLSTDQRVEFDITPGSRGPRAMAVRLL
jgi:CspA family cold shock protein